MPSVAKYDPSAARFRLGDPGGDAIRLPGKNQRTDIRFLMSWVAGSERSNAGGELLNEMGANILVDEDALGRDADLTGEVIPAFGERVHDRVQVGASVTMAGAAPPCSRADRVPGASFE